MTLEEKRRLIELLNETHSTTREILEGVDLDLVVYKDSGWRIRDILGHIAAWDRQVVNSLSAFRVDQEYALPDHNEAAFNKQDVLSKQDLPKGQILEEWEQAREAFKEAVEEIPVDQFPGDVLYPWGDERGTITYLVEIMIRHDIKHRDEILKVIQSSTAD